MIAGGDAAQLWFHIGRAIENGVTRSEIIEAVAHLAFQAGWPEAVAAAAAAREVFES